MTTSGGGAERALAGDLRGADAQGTAGADAHGTNGADAHGTNGADGQGPTAAGVAAAGAGVVAPGLDSLRLVRLLQLASPALPVGAYSYSQGLEWAIDAGWVADEASALEWIGDALTGPFGCCEAPALARLLDARAAADASLARRWNAWFRASRDTAELRAETLQMGQALARLARDLGLVGAVEREMLEGCAPVTLPLAYALVAHAWDVGARAAVAAYTFSWVENQVMAAVKAVPLGQTAGQRLLAGLGARIPAVCANALALPDDALSNFAPGLAIASSRHEVQYTRLFRS
jgi:urease accessory protein